MAAIWTIVGKDLRQRARDRSVFVIAIVVPLALTWVFSLLFQDLDDGGPPSVGIGVASLDTGPLALAFTEVAIPVAVERLEHQGGSLTVISYDAAGDLRADVEAGVVDAGVILPAGLTLGLATGQAALEVVVTPGRPVGAALVTTIVDQFAQQARGHLAAQVVVERFGADEATTARLTDALADVQARLALDSLQAGGQSVGFAGYLAGGMAVFFLFFTVAFGVLGHLEERQAGTLPRLLAAPVRAGEVIAAKVIVSLVVGMVAMAVLLVAAVPMLGASWGSPVVVAALVVAVTVAATSTVGLVAVLARTAEQANNWQSGIAIVLGMLGGSFFPLDGGPAWLAAMSRATPHGSFLQGLRTASTGGGLSDVAAQIAWLGTFAAGVVVATVVITRVRSADR